MLGNRTLHLHSRNLDSAVLGCHQLSLARPRGETKRTKEERYAGNWRSTLTGELPDPCMRLLRFSHHNAFTAPRRF